MPTGVIIAGGRSTRFGEADKAFAPIAGTPMIRRVADRLVDVVDALVVNCRRDQCDDVEAAMRGYPHPVTIAEDEESDLGPMAGIRTGLRAVESTYGFVVACDVPFVDPDVVRYLFERAADHEAAVPRLDDGWYQTTHAVYRATAMADACDEALARGERKIIAPLFELDYVEVSEADLREHGSLSTFDNCNTPEALAAAQNAFEEE
ncbi:molybdenum cofactor guanylyltransferase [Haloferacaceae archaeon DSL9]